MLGAIAHRALGTVLAAAGGGAGALVGAGLHAVGARAGVEFLDTATVSTALGVFGALMTAMAWIDHRIDRRFVDHERIERAEADKWRAELLSSVERVIRG